MLGERMVTSMLVEGGAGVLGSFFAAELIDKLQIYLAPLIIGGKTSPGPVGGAGTAQLALAPRFAGDKFRIIEHRLLHGNDFAQQAEVIRTLLGVYNVGKIVLDTSGIGAAVFQLVSKFFPGAIGLKFTAEIKAMMINKALNLFRQKRVE